MKKHLFCLLFLLILNHICFTQKPDISILQLRAPEIFKAVFKTSKGDFIIEANRKWSPLGVDRLFQLISSGFYTNALFFRVEHDFVIQFGVASNEVANRFWDPKKLPDEPQTIKNTRGMIAFARGGKNNRCTQIFISTVDNPKLDTVLRAGVKGYTPIARLINGMDILAKLNGQYGKRPAIVQDSLYKYGNAYFDQKFPGLDKILSAKIIK